MDKAQDWAVRMPIIRGKRKEETPLQRKSDSVI